MKYIPIILLTVVLQAFGAKAQTDVTARLILIGNADKALVHSDDLLKAVKNTTTLDKNTMVLFLGNYSSFPSDTALLKKEIDFFQNTDAEILFIPGYNEWAHGREPGFRNIVDQHQFIKNLNNKNIKMKPGKACPDPEKIKLGNDAVLFIMDSQWWLHEHNKPDIESGCDFRTKEEILIETEDIAEDEFDKLVIFASYHPFKNTGVHSGTFGVKQHIFPFTDIRKLGSFYLPLPLIGSLYPITRYALFSKQHMHHSEYESLVAKGIGTFPGVKKAFNDHPFVAFISGQEHNLQLMKEGKHYFINSGAGIGGGRVRHTQQTLYASEKKGFSVLEITKDKKLRTTFYEVSGENATPVYASDLIDYSKFPQLAKDTTTNGLIKVDSVNAIADKSFGQTSAIRHFLIGENYRKDWSTPVKMKVFRLNEELGGLEITGLGGGHESKSLQMKDKDGKRWNLRSVNKNLEAVIPEGVQHTLASDLIHEMLTGANPYSSLIVPGLLEPLNIVHASPEMRFVPNDPALKEYRPLFANTVMQLEERRPALNDIETEGTEVAVNDFIQKGDYFIDQRNFLKARLVDMLIADFDRHRKQWNWGTRDTLDLKLFYPVPKDRDNAFYDNSGFILKVARRGSYAYMNNFNHQIKNFPDLNRVGIQMDMFFANQLSEADWKATMNEFKSALSDSVLDAAVHRLPPEIYAIRGKDMYSKLQSRRNAIADRGLEYYRFLSKKVNVLGSNKPDIFRITGQENSNVLVQVFRKEKDGNKQLMYERSFSPLVTQEIRLYGFNDDDYFDVDESVRSRIKLKIIGGRGNDSFNIRGQIQNEIYDLSLEDNIVLADNHSTKMFAHDPSVNEYRFNEAVYNSLKFPVITLGGNEDDGFLAGAGIAYKTFGFRKYPYATNQRLTALWALSRRAYRLKYDGTFNHVFRRYDLIANAELYNPVLSYFFGLGNETKKDPSRSFEYYRTRYDYVSTDLQARKRFLNDSVMSISIGPSLFYYWNSRNRNQSRILEVPELIGLDSSGVYENKLYGGGKLVFQVNNLNSEFIPTRGIDWKTEFTVLKSMNDNSKPFTRLYSTMDLYATLAHPSKLLAALHLGGGHIFSDNFEYFQALKLGGTNYLRGFRRDRFAGSSSAYGSLELKLKLFDFNTYVVKGDFGIVGFNDVGRVWVKNETSGKWHHGYGGGVYVIPFEAFMLSAVVGFSEEDRVFNASLGAKLNIVFTD